MNPYAAWCCGCCGGSFTARCEAEKCCKYKVFRVSLGCVDVIAKNEGEAIRLGKNQYSVDNTIGVAARELL